MGRAMLQGMDICCAKMSLEITLSPLAMPTALHSTRTYMICNQGHSLMSVNNDQWSRSDRAVDTLSLIVSKSTLVSLPSICLFVVSKLVCLLIIARLHVSRLMPKSSFMSFTCNSSIGGRPDQYWLLWPSRSLVYWMTNGIPRCITLTSLESVLLLRLSRKQLICCLVVSKWKILEALVINSLHFLEQLDACGWCWFRISCFSFHFRMIFLTITLVIFTYLFLKMSLERRSLPPGTYLLVIFFVYSLVYYLY